MQPPQTGDKGSQSQPKAKFKGKCNHCVKPGHKEASCWKKKRDEAGKSRGADSAHATSDQGAAMRSGQEVYQDGGVTLDGVAFMMTDQEMLEHATFVSNKGGLELEKLAGAASCKGKEMLMVLDGASTVAVVQDESKCIDIEDVNKYIKTGGQGKPTLVHCKRQGVLPIDMIVDGKRLQVRLPARIIPGFGVDVLPECFFLKKNFSINKAPAVKF